MRSMRTQSKLIKTCLTDRCVKNGGWKGLLYMPMLHMIANACSSWRGQVSVITPGTGSAEIKPTFEKHFALNLYISESLRELVYRRSRCQSFKFIWSFVSPIDLIPLHSLHTDLHPMSTWSPVSLWLSTNDCKHHSGQELTPLVASEGSVNEVSKHYQGGAPFLPDQQHL